MLHNFMTFGILRGAKSEEGVTAIEYGLLAALIAVAIIVAVTLVGTNLAALFTGVATNLVLPAGG